MSLIPNANEKSPRKTDDFNAYMKQYRDDNLQHMRNLERCKYYRKKYNIDQELIDLFGEYAGDVFKLIKTFNDIKEKCPSIAPHIVSKLNEQQ